MNSPTSTIDTFVSNASQWQSEIRLLRRILLECGLDEALKWGKPCFMHNGKNLAIIQPFKAHCALMLFKGALIQDPFGLLRSQGEHSHSAMRLEFTQPDDIDQHIISTYIQLAIAVEKAGLKAAPKARDELQYPDELLDKFREDGRFEQAFRQLTPGRQRGYILHFSDAKQSDTRSARIEKYTPKILDGRGIHDR